MLYNAKACEINKKKVVEIYKELCNGDLVLSLPTPSQREEEKIILKRIKDNYGSIENIPIDYEIRELKNVEME